MLHVNAQEREELEVTQELVNAYAEVSGDFNKIHVDPEYAAKTRFGGTIAHGELMNGRISALLGNGFLGEGAIYVSTWRKFKAPVYVGTTVNIVVTVKKIEGRTATLDCRVIGPANKIAVEGEAVILLPEEYATVSESKVIPKLMPKLVWAAHRELEDKIRDKYKDNAGRLTFRYDRETVLEGHKLTVTGTVL